MISWIKNGNLFDSQVEALVNPVNCVGIMGAGLALVFKKKFPIYFEHYEDICRQTEMRLGKVVPYALEKPVDNLKYIINFPTKDHWKEKSHLINIKRGLIDLDRVIQTLGISSIAIPALGCGLGGLEWERVKEIICEVFAKYNCDDNNGVSQVSVLIYELTG